MSFIYLASPYTHTLPEWEEKRYREAEEAHAQFWWEGHVVYCPISASHHLSKNHALPPEVKRWRAQNYGILEAAKELWVLCMDGWEQSKGVSEEVAFAMGRGIPVHYYVNYGHGWVRSNRDNGGSGDG